MTKLLASVGALAVVIMLLKLAPAPVAGQGPQAARPGPVLKTPWGEPDLQGIWTDEYETPFERPARYAGKEFFTDEERVALDKQRASILRRDYRAKRGSEEDVAGAYNALFLSVRPTGRRTSLVVDPPDGRIPALTPEAQKRRAAIAEWRLMLIQATETCQQKELECRGGQYGPPSPKRNEPMPFYNMTTYMSRADGPEDRPMGERCMSITLPDFGGGVGGGFRQIVQSPSTVSIFIDTGQGQGVPRIIPITSSPHLPPHVRRWWGDARGRWDGNTLVVDVTNFTPKLNFRGALENLHLVERWTRLAANTLEYAVTFEDPTTWTKPWMVKQELTRQDNRANRIYYEPRCHEGNYGMAALLAGARADEKAFAEGRGPDPATRNISGRGLGPDDNQEPF